MSTVRLDLDLESFATLWDGGLGGLVMKFRLISGILDLGLRYGRDLTGTLFYVALRGRFVEVRISRVCCQECI